MGRPAANSVPGDPPSTPLRDGHTLPCTGIPAYSTPGANSPYGLHGRTRMSPTCSRGCAHARSEGTRHTRNPSQLPRPPFLRPHGRRPYSFGGSLGCGSATFSVSRLCASRARGAFLKRAFEIAEPVFHGNRGQKTQTGGRVPDVANYSMPVVGVDTPHRRPASPLMSLLSFCGPHKFFRRPN